MGGQQSAQGNSKTIAAEHHLKDDSVYCSNQGSNQKMGAQAEKKLAHLQHASVGLSVGKPKGSEIGLSCFRATVLIDSPLALVT